ncbi:hypothetical protein COCNU_10G006840 [Cocos nucifera]|uniref:Uncharacterized protein n=1 Tax=Cocos nucifera TaxID=13894 RepID=A0A8K0IM61_COCNU|nr:hypothetical protein COCNU_10G006840 [Cocos nucifera]
MKFGARKAKLPLKLVIKEVTRKFSHGRFQGKAEWSSARAGKQNEVRHEESRAPPRARRQESIKEVLPRRKVRCEQKSGMKFGARKIELPLELVVKEVTRKFSCEGKFGASRKAE